MSDSPEIIALLERIVSSLDSGSPEGLGPREAAAYLGISLSKVHSMNAAGQLPLPAELGDRLPRWSRTELKAWLIAGAPSRLRWQAMRDGALRRAG